jgi:disulfide bond formation protein DsbB
MNVYLYQYIVATPILALQVLLVVLLILVLAKKGSGLLRHIRKHALQYGFIASLAATLGSLLFSELYSYDPCKLCWLQRIFHFPQLVLFIVALKNTDTKVWEYIQPLSWIGLAIAMYQILMQFNPGLTIAQRCSAIPAASGCSDILVQAYGYISIPVMSATLFVTILVLATLSKRR